MMIPQETVLLSTRVLAFIHLCHQAMPIPLHILYPHHVGCSVGMIILPLTQGLILQLSTQQSITLVSISHLSSLYCPSNIRCTQNRHPKLGDPFLTPIFYCPPMYSAFCLLYTSPSPRDGLLSRMPSSA
eukprot:TRINITY_DN6711_c0_g1_i2.p1 TRINITY_DN6711_c0_g1~~TRINITY_DN6711_c0_g1_i2.p1  ORF type:complete len:129 (-),score=3.30 TRINITY_DN6711_c0_g1_i2:11-397(-)